MYRYIISRLLLVFPTLFGAATLVFILMRLVPGDICLVRLGSGGTSFTAAALAACHAEIGIDRSWILQYLDFMWGLARFDFGNSMWSGKPVIIEIATRLPISLEVAIVATIIAVVIAIPLGTISALKQNSWIDLAGAQLLDRRTGDAVLLARHHVDPDRARRDAGDHRPSLDAADRLRAAVEGPDPQPVDRHAAGDHDRLSLCRGVDADDPLGDARSVARGLHPHRPRQGSGAAR